MSWSWSTILWSFIIFTGSSTAVARDSLSVRLFCLGDINLGRALGQRLLQGDTGVPFAKVRHYWSDDDIVFANLESIISDQGGETVSPHSNIVFCAPPISAKVLQHAKVSVVSLANNHAFDYGKKGIDDAIRTLDSCNIAWVGVLQDSTSTSTLKYRKKDISFGFVAYTKILNIQRGRKYVALFDSVRVQREIALLKPQVDIVLASYHGGVEYAEREDSLTFKDMEFLSQCGADIVIGHHPHVPLGVHKIGSSYVFSSLGNFIFYQPQRYWTQYGAVAEFIVTKAEGKTRIESWKLLPVRAGYQPSFQLTTEEKKAFVERIRILSTIPVQFIEKGPYLEISEY